VIDDTKHYSRGKFNQAYETPYGPVNIERHVYETAKGWKTYVPLEHKAHLVLNSTPRFAKMVTFKMANMLQLLL
jgi:hypothetical protein